MKSYPGSNERFSLPESEPTLGIVIPVYNEAENILGALEAIAQHTPVQTTVWIVGDSEEDTTFAVLEHFEASLVEVRPLINGFGPGALNAIKWGLHSAEQSAVLVTMADLSDDMATLPHMWQHFLDGSDLVCGSRYMRGGQQLGGPFVKSVLSRIAGLSLHYMSGLPTKDVTNSFKLYSRKVLDRIDIESQGGFEVGMEIVVKAWALGFHITEVPTTWHDRTDGESRFKLVAWLPSYLKWYFHGLRVALSRRLGI